VATSVEGVPAAGMKRPSITILPQTIRGKLVVAFGVVAATAIVAGVVGQSSYEVVNEKLATITEVSVPSMVAAQRIGEVTARIAAAAPALHSAATETELDVQLDRLNAHLTELQASVEQLAELSDDAGRVRRLNVLAGQVASMFEAQADNVKTRILFAEQSRMRVDRLIHEHLEFNNAIKPTIEAEKQAFSLSSRKIIDATEQAVDHLNQMSMKGLFPILTLRVQANNIAQAISAGYRAATEAEIDAAWRSFVSANSLISRQLGDLERNQALAGMLDIEPLRELFSQFTSLGAGEANVFDRRRAQLGSLPDSSDGQVLATGELEERLASLEADLERALNVMITLIRGRTATESVDLHQDVSSTLDRMTTEGLGSIGDLQELEALGNQIVGVLTVATRLGTEADLDTFKGSFSRAAEQMDSILQRYAGDQKLEPIEDSAQRILGFGRGERDMFAERSAELQAIAGGQHLLAESLGLVEGLSATAAEIVATTRVGSAQAAGAATQSLKRARWTLFGAGGAGMLALLTVWLYVRRSLGVRLSALSDSMLAIAGGDLRAPLPPSDGRDEIARMAQALRGFRDTEIEIEEMNLRERQVVLDTIDYGVLILDPELRVRMYNRAFCNLWGIPEDVLRGRPTVREVLESARNRGLHDVPDAEWAPYVERRLAEMRKAEMPPREWHRPDGRVLQYEVASLPDGGRMLTYFDLTALKEVEGELRGAKEQAELANRHKSEFLANMSHELRTPLNAVLGYVELIRDGIYGEVSDKLRDVLERVQHNGRHLLGLINDVLDLSKIEAGELKLAAADYDMREVILGVVGATEALATEKRLELEIDVPADLPPGHGDERRITQVLMNLVGNAIKFTEAGSVAIRASVEGDSLLVSVADSGAGIAVEDQARIFQEFQQVDSSSTRKKGGTGLGLAIARRIVELHGGRIWVESTVGQGATFCFTLPPRVGGRGKAT
jgi:signal transduction histidine kinase/HAMP domain-containing protein